MLDVVGDVAEVEPGFFDQLQLRVFFQRLDIGRARMQGDLALAGLEFLHPYRGIGVDRKNQLVEFDSARVPVLFVARIANLRVLLVTLEHERPGADRLLVDVAGFARGQQLVGVLGRENRGETHGEVLDERSVD
ncbi:hypothetical protein D3C76_1358760 [compost metagenome]